MGLDDRFDWIAKMEDKEWAQKLHTTTTVDAVSKMGIYLNQFLETQAAQVRREHEHPKTNQPSSTNGLDHIFLEINPAPPSLNSLQQGLLPLRPQVFETANVQLTPNHFQATFSVFKTIIHPPDELLEPQRSLEIKTTIFWIITYLCRISEN